MVKSGNNVVNQGFIHNTLEDDALNALIALGIIKGSAEAALKKARASSTEELNLETLIKKSLQFI
jgi:Holliday junction DNA helicase RuvA